MEAYNTDYIYDIETFPNVFTFSAKHVITGECFTFEISYRRNDVELLVNFIYRLRAECARMVGFNNIGFDYPVLHYILNYYQTGLTPYAIYTEALFWIKASKEEKFARTIWDNDRVVEQLDLFKIHHFDNNARSTSLKILEFNMRSDNIEDLPFEPGTFLNPEQIDVLIKYNGHDVNETLKFYLQSLEMIKFRMELGEKHGCNFLNHSDKKIGTDLFINAIEESAPGSCFFKVNGKKQKRQTIRESINLADVILPIIKFKEPEFERIKNYLEQQTITNFDEKYLNIKGIFKDLIASINGFNYKFGSGGIHASIDSTIVYSDNDYEIADWDVGGFYPEIGGAFNLFPEHLSDQFCVVNEQLKQERKQYKKGTPLNLAIKLARNGAYGDSNNQYSPFYDPQYTLSITINGQLLLCMLAQYLIDIPGLQMIQVNTDGLTVRCPRVHVYTMNTICKWWQDYTCLELEKANYKRMFIRDVNNYIGEYENGKLKRKGAYAHETPLENPNTQEVLWHKNHSALIIPKAAEAALVRGEDIREFIINHVDIMDFMLRAKVNKSDHLVLGDKQLQRITRYYISNSPAAGSLVKVSPPTKGHTVGSWKRATKLTDQFYNNVLTELRNACPHVGELDTDGLPWDERINTKNKSKYVIRETGFNVGWKVITCNNIKDARRENINYNFYISEAEKLINPLR